MIDRERAKRERLAGLLADLGTPEATSRLMSVGPPPRLVTAGEARETVAAGGVVAVLTVHPEQPDLDWGIVEVLRKAAIDVGGEALLVPGPGASTIRVYTGGRLACRLDRPYCGRDVYEALRWACT